ncbi:MAG: MerR family transcriptional regulator [Pseudomonadota bacterium]
MSFDLTTPRFAQPEVLNVIRGLSAGLLQTWVNRGHIVLSDQNPGSGRRRLYSPIDIVKLALMARLASFGISVQYSKSLITMVEKIFAVEVTFDWDWYFAINYQYEISVKVPEKFKHLGPLELQHPQLWRDFKLGDPVDLRVSDFVEVQGLPHMRRDQGQGPVIPERRREWAAKGYHAEPALILPIGEIVNGTLIQLETMEAEGEGKDDV